MKAPLLAKATWGITHFATAIPTNAVMTALDATYLAIKTPFSILKTYENCDISIFKWNLEAYIWKRSQSYLVKRKWFVARTRDSW